MVNYDELFIDFNDSVTKTLQDKLSKLTPSDEKDFVSNMDLELEKLNALVSLWEVTPIKFLNGSAPKEYFNNIKDDSEILESFKSFSKNCDIESPNCMIIRMSQSDYIISKLIEYSTSMTNSSDSASQDLGFESIRILGKIKSENCILPFISFMQTLGKPEENILDMTSEALYSIGKVSIEPLLTILETVSDFNICHEYMLRALSKIGSSHKSDRIYKVLKDAFRSLSNKTFAVLLLGDYGDGRAIPALKGYAGKNASTISKELLYEIKYVVGKLGGKFN